MNYSIVVDDERGGTIVGNCTARDWKGDPISIIDHSGKKYNVNKDGKFE